MRRAPSSIRRLLTVFALLLPLVADAQTKMPESAADHLALAKSYQEKAAAYHKEAAEHKAMAEAYKKSVPGPTKAAGENPWAKKMEAHCRAIEADAEKLAADAEKAAEFHKLRAKELQGK
ncbi:MAG: hypothetical protein ACXVDD_24815 [Polyangia bacterium]